MGRRGKVLKATYDNWSYPNKEGKPIHRHTIVIQLEDSTVVEGKYDSMEQLQTKFVPDHNVEFDTVMKAPKSGGPQYAKFKITRPPYDGGFKGKKTDDPLVRGQIQRSSTLYLVPEVAKIAKGKELFDIAIELNQWVVTMASNDKQRSIMAQSSLIAAVGFIELKEIKNMDHLLEVANGIFKYIHG